MPISLPPISRRRFLAHCVAGSSTLVIAPHLLASQADHDPDRIALFSDTHIAGDREKILRDTNMANNLQQAIREALSTKPVPAAALVSGDCALLRGEIDDYRTLTQLVDPLHAADVPLHFALGNHDNRAHFLEVITKQKPAAAPVAGKYITIVESRHADWYLLDSLDQTNKTAGVLGAAQVSWLDQTLRQRTTKPAIVMLHHHPDSSPKPSGLVETKELLDLLVKHPHVKALFFGHSHHWDVRQHAQLHLVNLPAVAYVFAAGEPNGWVDAQLHAGGMQLCLNCIDKKHPRNGQRVDLKWWA